MPTFESNDILRLFCDYANLSKSEALRYIEMSKRQDTLSAHDIKITACSDGNYLCNYYIGQGGYVSSKKGDDTCKRFTIRRSTKKAIEDYILNLIKERENNPTIEELFSMVCKIKLELDHIEQATILRNQREFKRLFSDFSNRRIKDIDIQDIEIFLTDTKRKYDLTNKSYNMLVSIVRSIFVEAYRQKLIRRDFDFESAIKGASYCNSKFKKTKKADCDEVYTKDEAETLICYLWDNIEKNQGSYLHNRSIMHDLGILLLFETGLRVGELAVLRWDDFKDSCIYVHATETETMINGKHAFIVSEHPKTDAGNRLIPIQENQLKIFNLAREHNPTGEFIFSFNGERIKSSKFRNRLKRVCEKAGVSYKHPHTIRKTFATRLKESGVPEHIIIAVLGHTNISTTDQHYIKNRNSVIEIREALDNVSSF